MSKPLLQGRNLHKSYPMGRQPLHVLRGVDLRLGKGEFLAVVGASGSGKSTLLHVLALLDAPEKGQVLLDGTDVYALPGAKRDVIRNRAFGFVFQFYHLLPELNLLENVLMPCLVGARPLAWLKQRRQRRAEAAALLEKLGVAARARHRPSQLSGGEQQRAAIARALINRPRILLADEPTGNLDSRTGQDILDLLMRLNREHEQSIIMVTHNPTVAGYAHRVLHLADGQILPE